MADWSADVLPLILVGKTNHQRNTDSLFKHHAFRCQTMTSHHIAMIGGEYHDGIVTQARFLQRIENSADMCVDKTAEAPVVSDQASPVVRGPQRHAAMAPFAIGLRECASLQGLRVI